MDVLVPHVLQNIIQSHLLPSEVSVTGPVALWLLAHLQKHFSTYAAIGYHSSSWFQNDLRVACKPPPREGQNTRSTEGDQ